VLERRPAAIGRHQTISAGIRAGTCGGFGAGGLPRRKVLKLDQRAVRRCRWAIAGTYNCRHIWGRFSPDGAAMTSAFHPGEKRRKTGTLGRRLPRRQGGNEAGPGAKVLSKSAVGADFIFSTYAHTVYRDAGAAIASRGLGSEFRIARSGL